MSIRLPYRKLSLPLTRFTLPLLAALALSTAPASAQGPLRYDEVCWLTTHNSFANDDQDYKPELANQNVSITRQLNAGVRCLMFDIYLMRQYEDGWSIWHHEDYDYASDEPSDDFEGKSLEVVLAHGPTYYLLQGYPSFNDKFRAFKSDVDEVHRWLADNPGQVVTFVLESYVDDAGFLFNTALKDIKGMIFYADRPNQAITAPDGQPWEVRRHGWPPLSRLVSAGKRVVIFSSNGDDDGAVPQWSYMVENVYGDDSLDDDECMENRSASAPLGDLTKALFFMNYFRSVVLTGDLMANIDNDKDEILEQVDIIRATSKRPPNFLSVDFFNVGLSGGAPSAVNAINSGHWGQMPSIAATVEVSPPANQFGWHNEDISLRFNGVTSSGNIQTISRSIRHESGSPDAVGYQGPNTDNVINTDGESAVNYIAVGSQGQRSDVETLFIYRDTVLPSATATLGRQPNAAGWYKEDVAFTLEGSDNAGGSGLHLIRWALPPSQTWETSANSTESITVTREAVNVIPFGSLDRADNASEAQTLTVRLDKTGPTLTAAADPPYLWSPNNKMVPVTVSGLITDATSGVDLTSGRYSVVDEYGQVQPGGTMPIAADGTYSFTIDLQASRLGRDRDGRTYTVTVRALDIAENESTYSFVVNVLHDRNAIM